MLPIFVISFSPTHSFTKLGYAGNYEPDALIPTFIATQSNPQALASDAADLDFFIGQEATVPRATYNVDYPIREGVVSNWDNMEKYLQRCIYQHLRADPEEHYFLMTEPPLNTPENREYTAEIMFETFNVPGLYIAVQAVLALCASMLNLERHETEITGTVVDSGDGVTHIVPVVSGYVIGSCIKHIPMAGRTITDFIADQLRARNEPVPPEHILDVARRIKEMHCYVCSDLVKEYNKYDAAPDKNFVKYESVDKKTGKSYSVDVGYERFLGPELFFNPEIFSSDFSVPLPDVLDQCIQACPIDTRKQLYNHITLSGGSTMFKNFTRRIERDVKRRVEERHIYNKERFPEMELKMLDVNVVTHSFQRFAVWFGGSMMCMQPEFLKMFHTRQEYQEQGPRIARANAAFANL